jgi:hypothetical protein
MSEMVLGLPVPGHYINTPFQARVKALLCIDFIDFSVPFDERSQSWKEFLNQIWIW